MCKSIQMTGIYKHVYYHCEFFSSFPDRNEPFHVLYRHKRVNYYQNYYYYYDDDDDDDDDYDDDDDDDDDIP